MKNAKGVDNYAEWSNDVDRGERPRLLEISKKGQTTKSGRGFGRTQQPQRLDEGDRTSSESTNEIKAEKVADNDEQSKTTENKLVFPEGDLFINVSGDLKKATDRFKSVKSMAKGDKTKFDENMSRKIVIDNNEMTRLEAVEKIAKDELDENKIKLNEIEKTYLGFLRENLTGPLKAIQKAGLQKISSLNNYNFFVMVKFDIVQTGDMGVTDYCVSVFDSDYDKLMKDSNALYNLNKLAKALNGVFAKNTEGKYAFYFKSIDDTHIFTNATDMLAKKAHTIFHR